MIASPLGLAWWRILSITLLVIPVGEGGGVQAQQSYRFLATAESEDEVALIEFTPCSKQTEQDACGVRTLRTYTVGLWAPETEGPHGVVASQDGTSFFVSLAHGRPFGYLQKIDLTSGRQTGLVELGMFPATVDRASFEGFVWLVNFNFEDPTVSPSSVSVVDGETMIEVARPMTCRMPHGSRMNPQGTRHYSGCMMDDLLVEIDARTFTGTRAFRLVAGEEGEVPFPSFEDDPSRTWPPVSNQCSPTWAQPSADGTTILVACNRSAEIVEVDAATWNLRRRWKTPPAPYNLAVSPDGRFMVATQKGPGSVSVWRLEDAHLLADIKGTRGVASGVVVSADSRYAFATLEGVGGQPGTIDIIDLERLEKVATVEIGKQAGGIALMP